MSSYDNQNQSQKGQYALPAPPGSYGGPPAVPANPMKDYSQTHANPNDPRDNRSKGDGFCRGLCAGLCCYCCLDMCF